MKMTVFPLPERPKQTFIEGARAFGAPRSGGKRRHAGVDLIAKPETPIYAMRDGVVTKGPYHFYSGTFAVEITGEDGMVIRYCEMELTWHTVEEGQKVVIGQQIGTVGQLESGASMLHLEVYSGEASGKLTRRGANIFSRRKDLVDPTSMLGLALLKKDVLV